MPKSKFPSHAYIKHRFDYNPHTGVLSKKFSTRSVGYENEGRRRLKVDGWTFTEHIFIWYWVTGQYLGEKQIIHLNGDRTDNRWRNLALRPTNKCSPLPIELPCVTTCETPEVSTFGTLRVMTTASGTLIFTPRTHGWIRKCAQQRQRRSA